MEFKFIAKNLHGEDFNVKLNTIPDLCPICHRKLIPKNILNFYLESKNHVQAVFQCPNLDCQQIFIGNYRSHYNPSSRWYDSDLINTAPKTYQPQNFPETIKEVSPTFIEVFNQSLTAESFGLKQIVGIGLRKSLEFLVKDFAIRTAPSEAEKIKSNALGNCINEYLNDTNLKECARRAAWLGNDETHYIRIWEDKDVDDLKTLIRLTVNWVDNSLMTEKYILSMNPIPGIFALLGIL